MMAARPGGPGLLPGGLTAGGGPPPGSIPVSMAGIPVSGKYIVLLLNHSDTFPLESTDPPSLFIKLKKRGGK